MGIGTRRNKPCWCGSGLSYKKCHLGRQSELPISKEEVRVGLQSEFGRKECLHPCASDECRSQSIKAHTIQRNGVGLKTIARNSQVYTFQASVGDVLQNNLLMGVRLIATREASTFFGFCGKHDKETFQPVEDHDFTGTGEQCFLLAYRSICHGLYKKRAILNTFQSARKFDKGRSLQEQLFLQQSITRQEQGARAAERDVTRLKETYDALWLQKDYSSVCYCILDFEGPVDVLSSSLFLPVYDFDGVRIQETKDLSIPVQYLTVSFLASGTLDKADAGGSVVFSWLAGNEPADLLMRSLLSLGKDAIPHAVLRLLLSQAENTFFAPAWWETLPKTTQEAVQARIRRETSPFTQRSPNYLKDDGVKALRWKFIGHRSNMSF